MGPMYFRAFTLYHNYQTSYTLCISDYAYACLRQTLYNCLCPNESTMLDVIFYDEKFSTDWQACEFLKAQVKAGHLIDKVIST